MNRANRSNRAARAAKLAALGIIASAAVSTGIAYAAWTHDEAKLIVAMGLYAVCVAAGAKDLYDRESFREAWPGPLIGQTNYATMTPMTPMTPEMKAANEAAIKKHTMEMLESERDRRWSRLQRLIKEGANSADNESPLHTAYLEADCAYERAKNAKDMADLYLLENLPEKSVVAARAMMGYVSDYMPVSRW